MNPLGVLMARKRSVRDVRAVLRLRWSFRGIWFDPCHSNYRSSTDGLIDFDLQCTGLRRESS